MNFIDLPAVKTARGVVRLPGSKSISNRVLLLAALADGVTEYSRFAALRRYGKHAGSSSSLRRSIVRVGKDHYRVHGVAGQFPLSFPVREAEFVSGQCRHGFSSVDCRTGAGAGHYRLSGVPRMHERPIGDLVDALRQLGADITYLGEEGFLAAANQTRRHSCKRDNSER